MRVVGQLDSEGRVVAFEISNGGTPGNHTFVRQVKRKAVIAARGYGTQGNANGETASSRRVRTKARGPGKPADRGSNFD